jgi:rSAM/selenodomain-associated transferase 1
MRSERLIVFTRYPEVGKVKTRLIPALGADDAARLHRALTEHTLTWARALLAQRRTKLSIYFTGGDRASMRKWLGPDLDYADQGQGDLGRRLARAFDRSFRSGDAAVVIVGTDCLELESARVADAFDALLHKDLVLGPAHDGGYYLIGLSRPVRQLFAGIEWGTDRVLARTQAIAKQLELSVELLVPLPDVDRPEDLRNARDFLHKDPIGGESTARDAGDEK